MSWQAEALLDDPNARPAEDDLAGIARFYAWEWLAPDGFHAPWGQGEGRYGSDCQQVTFQLLADEIDRLNGLLADEEPYRCGLPVVVFAFLVVIAAALGDAGVEAAVWLLS